MPVDASLCARAQNAARATVCDVKHHRSLAPVARLSIAIQVTGRAVLRRDDAVPILARLARSAGRSAASAMTGMAENIRLTTTVDHPITVAFARGAVQARRYALAGRALARSRARMAAVAAVECVSEHVNFAAVD